jgi:hypothetical protein
MTANASRFASSCPAPTPGDCRYLPAPTGRRAVWEAIGIFRVTDGKIWGTADRLRMLTRLACCPTSAERIRGYARPDDLGPYASRLVVQTCNECGSAEEMMISTRHRLGLDRLRPPGRCTSKR